MSVVLVLEIPIKIFPLQTLFFFGFYKNNFFVFPCVKFTSENMNKRIRVEDVIRDFD